MYPKAVHFAALVAAHLMFGYSCENCPTGKVRLRYFKSYRARLRDVFWTIPRAKIGVCDVCAERYYHIKEYKRWQKLKPK